MPWSAQHTHYLTYQYTPNGQCSTVLSKHTVKRLRELVRTRINLSGYSKMAKQDLISAILKRKELFADIVELEDSRCKNADPFFLAREKGEKTLHTLTGPCKERR